MEGELNAKQEEDLAAAAAAIEEERRNEDRVRAVRVIGTRPS